MAETDVFARDFEPVDFETWRARVTKDLKGKDVASLARTIAQGVQAQVLYEEGDEPRSALGRAAEYVIEQEYAQPGPARAAGAIADDAARGAGAAWVRLGENLQAGDAVDTADGVGVGLDRRAAMRRLLRDCDPASLRLTFECGAAALPVAAMLEQVLDGREDANLASMSGGVLADPWAPLARRGRLAVSDAAALDDLALHVSILAERAPSLRSLGVSVVGYHDAGADAVDEIGIALATAIEYLRALDARGVAPELGLSRLDLRVAVGSDVSAEVAKLRALRACFRKLAAAFDCDAPIRIHARGSWRERSKTDPWVNLLRATAESFAAVVGGADGGCTTALDAADGPPSDFARRLAVNTQVLLVEESHLARVADPARGASAIESLTDELARAGWARMQGIESTGGMLNALRRGSLVEELADRAAARAATLSSGRAARIAVNRFAPVVEREVPRTTPQDPAAVRLGAPEDEHAAGRVAALATHSGPGRIAAIHAAIEAGATVDRVVGARADTEPALSVPPLVQERISQPYEALRARVKALPRDARRVGLVTVGELPGYKQRVDGLRERFGAVGLELEEGPSPVVAVVGSDAALEAEGAKAKSANAGASRLVVMGRASAMGSVFGDDALYWNDVDDVLAFYEDLISVLEAQA